MTPTTRIRERRKTRKRAASSLRVQLKVVSYQFPMKTILSMEGRAPARPSRSDATLPGDGLAGARPSKSPTIIGNWYHSIFPLYSLSFSFVRNGQGVPSEARSLTRGQIKNKDSGGGIPLGCTRSLRYSSGFSLWSHTVRLVRSRGRGFRKSDSVSATPSASRFPKIDT